MSFDGKYAKIQRDTDQIQNYSILKNVLGDC